VQRAAFAELLVERGAAKVYAGARDPSTVRASGVVPIRLDVTSDADVTAAAAACGDATVLVNNAGIATTTGALAPNAIDAGMGEMATNVWGLLALTRAFVPVLGANGGGAVVNVLSVLSWLSSPLAATYCASKAAAWSVTNALRMELAPQGTLVVGVHAGFIDTDMTAGIDAPKLAPVEVAATALDAVETGAFEVLADDISRHVRSSLGDELAAMYPELAA
jgi:NAD(P)-dependent dehydrogenase (short-subunit alcohol dehydrogenase family)